MRTLKAIFGLLICGVFFSWGLRYLKFWGRDISVFGFKYLGSYFFVAAEELSIKQILLEGASHIGKQVLVEGEVLSTGKYGTYLVLDDDSSSIVVVTTILKDMIERFEHSRVRILGVIENGKTGLPLLRAWEIQKS